MMRENLLRLARARNVAEQAGLYETAERLEAIRKELTAFKDIPPRHQSYKAAWALVKVEEAKDAMAREFDTPGTVLSDRRADKDSGAIMAKIGLCVCTMFGGMLAILANESHRILTGAAFVIGTIAAALAIDNMIGSKEPQESAEHIRKTLEDLRKALTCRLIGRR